MGRATLTPEEVGQMMGASLNTVYAGLKKGDIPGRKVGRRWIIGRDRFLSWLNGEEEESFIVRRQTVADAEAPTTTHTG